MRKRLMSSLLTLCIVFTLLPATALAATSEVNILSYPTKIIYKVGEGFDTNGLNVSKYVDGKQIKLNDKITFFTSKTVELTPGRPFTTTGTKVVELRYEGNKVGEYTITVLRGTAAPVIGWPFIPSDKNMTTGKIKSGWAYIYSHDDGTFRVNEDGNVSPSRKTADPFYIEHLGKDKYYIRAAYGGYLAYEGKVTDKRPQIIVSDEPCKWFLDAYNEGGVRKFALVVDADHKYVIRTWGFCTETMDSQITLHNTINGTAFMNDCKFTVSSWVSDQTIPQWWKDYKDDKPEPTGQVEKPKVFGDVPENLDHTNQQEWDVLRLTNIERAKAGLPLLVTFDRMQLMTGVRSDELVIVYSHTRPNGLDPFSVFQEHGFSNSTGAENIAMGQNAAETVVNDWMNSEGHRKNILTEKLRYMGTGYTYGDDSTHWVQLFASGSDSDCRSLSYNEGLGYFTLKLKNGITAYAPYDPGSSPIVNGKVTFHYPGAGSTTPTKPPSGLEILQYPTKTSYKVGEGFDNTGLNVVNTVDGQTTSANDKITFYTSKVVELTQGRPFTTAGTKVVELRYEGKTVAEYKITVIEGSTAVTPPANTVIAAPSKTNFVMNGQPASVTAAYTIKGTNYLQLRAIAVMLNGTTAQFDVGWDGQYAVIEPGKPYSGTVTDIKLQSTTNIRQSGTKFKINGEVFTFTDARLIDGDTNYLQLREFAQKLNGTASQFNVYWDSVAGQAVIQPGVVYTGKAS